MCVLEKTVLITKKLEATTAPPSTNGMLTILLPSNCKIISTLFKFHITVVKSMKSNLVFSLFYIELKNNFGMDERERERERVNV